MATQFKEILNRLTGISTPIFGVSWNPSEPERARAKRVIALLEDRRVLYVPGEMEVPEHCVHSVIEIRHFLTDELQALQGGESEGSLRAMRATCRKFLEVVQRQDGYDVVRFGAHQGHFASWVFNGALGELRGVFGLHVARLAAAYCVDVEEDLASILPAEDE